MADATFSLPTGLPADVTQPTGFLQTLLTVSLTAVAVLRPLYADGGETIRDFAWVSLNPAGQQMLGQPACPAGSLLMLFPAARATEDFARYCHAYLTGELTRSQTNYQADGVDGYFLTVAQRYENVLVVNFTDTNNQPRAVAEQARRESQAAEQLALAEAEAQRAHLTRVFQQAPAAICVLDGPALTFELVNPLHQRLFPGRALLGRPLREAMPELWDHEGGHILRQVYETGVAHETPEILVPMRRVENGPVEAVYFRNVTQPRLNTRGQVDGVLLFTFDITKQVLERQQVEQLNQELAARNEELRASNQEYLAANQSLLETQHQLRQLNAELEARVQERTQVAGQALATAERERTLLQIILAQSPVAIGVFQGEELRITATNAQMAALWGRTPEQVIGLPFMEAVPELRGQGFDDIMRQVLQTQVSFIGKETAADVLRGEQVETHYYNFVYQPLYDADGQLLGAIDVAVEVTEQVLARRQVEQLNQELEARVLERTEQLREAQAAAERERAQLQALLTQAPVAISLFEGEDLRVALANPLIAKLWGYTPEQVLDRPLLEAVPELRGQGFDDLLRQVLHTRVPFSGKETPALLRSDDQLHTLYFNFVYQPLYDAEGQVLGVINVATDVTEQVLARQQVEQLNQELEARVQQRTQQALGLQAEVLAAAQQQAQAREAFYQVFEQTPALVALLRGADHRYEYVNPAYQALFAGRTLVGLPVAEAIPELAAQGFNTLLKRVYQTGETYFGLELPFTPAAPADQPARTRYYTFTYQALREAGEVVGISVFAYDVTAQLQEREASSQQLRLITDSLPVLISYLDHEQRYRFVNQAYQAWFNQRPDELLGQPVREVVGEQAYQAVKPYIERALAGERLEFESRMPYREGFTKYIHTTYVPAERRGERAGFYTLTFDVTEQVLARQQVQALNEELTTTNQVLQQTNQQLTRTNVDLDTFVYTASHDLKAPITNIESITLALRATLPAEVQQDEMIAHLLDLLEQTTKRFQVTIGQLTDLSKLQLAHAGPAEPVNLAAVIKSVRLDLAPLILAADAQLTVEVAPDLVVSFSPANLRSAVYNLLSNALKYRALDRPAQVQVRAARTGQQVVVEVQDNGLGLNAHQQQRLFGLFQRLHTHVEGTGVGLYITKRLVENGGGTIAVESQVDVGTTFTLTFPA